MVLNVLWPELLNQNKQLPPSEVADSAGWTKWHVCKRKGQRRAQGAYYNREANVFPTNVSGAGERHAVFWAGLYCIPSFEGKKGGKTDILYRWTLLCSSVNLRRVIRKIQSGLGPLLGKHTPPPPQHVAAGELPPSTIVTNPTRFSAHTVLPLLRAAPRFPLLRLRDSCCHQGNWKVTVSLATIA